MRFQTLSISRRVLIVTGIFVVPLAVLGWFFLNDKNDLIEFAQKEIVGSQFAPAAHANLIDLTADHVPADQLTADTAALASSVALAGGLGVQFDTAGVSPGEDASAAKRDQAAANLSDVIGNVEDKSNLTLDPDLDSYFLQDALLVQLIGIVQGARDVARASFAPHAGRQGQASVELALAQARLRASMDAFNTDMQKAEKGSSDGSIGALNGAANDVSTNVDGLIRASNGHGDSREAWRDVSSAARKFAPVGDAELEHLLHDRISGLRHTIVSHLTIVLVLVLIGAFIARTVSLSIIRPMRGLVDATALMASGDRSVEIPCCGEDNELGELATAIDTFKRQLAEAERQKAEQDALLECAKAEQTALIVGSIGAGLEALAQGNLAHRVTTELTGAFLKLKDDFNAAVAQLEGVIGKVLLGTKEVTAGTSEISAAADDLSRRTENQVASLEETAAALEEITATLGKTAKNAADAMTIVGAAKAAAEEGGGVADTAIRAMDQIEDSASRITDIISVIDEIAFQTNLLALNAGVEAARAGDAGKGFAVVASEVRALAQRSSEAAKEIKALIIASSTHVAAGVKLVSKSGETLKQIVAQVAEINTIMGDMSQSAHQQSVGIQQVNVAVTQMDQVTQQNAAMVEQSTAASRKLAMEAEELLALTDFFKVKDNPDPEGRRRRLAA